MQEPKVRHGNIIRTGRGYSLEELKEAGIDHRLARKNGMPVDKWRQTRHPENVEWLKSITKNFNPKREKASKKKKE